MLLSLTSGFLTGVLLYVALTIIAPVGGWATDITPLIIISTMLWLGWWLLNSYHHSSCHRSGLMILSVITGFGYFHLRTSGTAGQLTTGPTARAIFHTPSLAAGAEPSRPSQASDRHYTWQIERVSLSGQRALLSLHSYDFAKQITYPTRYRLFASSNCTAGALAAGAARMSPSGWLTCQRYKPRGHTDRLLAHICKLLQCTHSVGGAWAYSSLFGDRAKMDQSTLATLRYFGLVHLSAVSGFHLSLMVVFIRLMLLLILTLGRTICRWAGAGLQRLARCQGPFWPLKYQHHRSVLTQYGLQLTEILILLGWLYLITFKPSAVRAFLCYLTVIGFRTWKREPTFAHLIILPLVGCCLMTPLDLWSFSSILSWVSYSYIMVIFYRFIRPQPYDPAPDSWPRGRPARSHKWLSLLKMWLYSQLGLQWISFLMVGEMSWLGLAGNMLVLPVLSLQLKMIMAAGVASMSIGLLLSSPWLPYVQWPLHQLLHLSSMGFAALAELARWALTHGPMMILSYQLQPHTLMIAELLTLVLALILVATLTSHPRRSARRL